MKIGNTSSVGACLVRLGRRDLGLGEAGLPLVRALVIAGGAVRAGGAKGGAGGSRRAGGGRDAMGRGAENFGQKRVRKGR